MKHEGSTIIAVLGKIGTSRRSRARLQGPSPPHTGSRGGDLADARVPTLPETDEGRS
jgi:hypothetical protein